jgi:hypothetical protein
MFTRHEIFKHIINPDESNGEESSSDDEDFFSEIDNHQHKQRQEKVKNLSITLHLIDRSFIPNSSSLTRLEPIDPTPQERVIRMCIGDGSQSFRWLALTAKQRLYQCYHQEGLIRQREKILGRMGSFLPTSISSEDPETDGEFLGPNMILNTVIENGDHLWLHFDQAGGSSITSWEKEAFFRGTSGQKYSEGKKMDNDQLESQVASEPVVKPIGTSIFFARKYESDSHDYYDSKELLKRAFKSDWSRWKSKPRFFKNIDQEVKKSLYCHYNNLRAVFRFYASSGGGEPFTISMNEFVKMTRECQIPEHTLGVLWSETNYNPDDPKQTDHVLERHEFLEIIMRLATEIYITNSQKSRKSKPLDKAGAGGIVEGVAEVVGVTESAGEDFVKEKKSNENAVHDAVIADPTTDDETNINDKVEAMIDNDPRNSPITMATAVDRLMDEHINAYCWKDIQYASTLYADPDAFRRDRFYFEEVNCELLKHSDDLLVLFETYAQKSALRLREFNSTLKLLCYKEFEDILNFSGLLFRKSRVNDGKSNGKAKEKKKGKENYKGSLTILDIRRSFVFAQMTCANNLNRNKREKSQDLQNRSTFIEFCEALARLCDIVQSKKANVAGELPVLSSTLAPFLASIIDGIGEEFWKKYRNKGHYHRTVTKKFGNHGKGIENYGPEVGRYELDKSAEAVAYRKFQRKNSTTQLPKSLSYIRFEVDEVKEEENVKRRSNRT